MFHQVRTALSGTELVYVYGFTEDSCGNKVAWRRLQDGNEIIQTEIACHVTEPSGGVGLMIGHFLDGTSEEIPGMLSSKSRAPMGEVRKRPSSVLKRPAGPMKRPAIATSESECDAEECEADSLELREHELVSSSSSETESEAPGHAEDYRRMDDEGKPAPTAPNSSGQLRQH